ncbi:MAG: YgiQ family radical SAM protein [Eubacteriales bacterium]|nr:YgiQ family radical SAM protein [Eubacteriales bacterium]
MREDFLPVTAQDMRERGWDESDFVYVCGDAYVDHPSFGHAIISRVLEKAGFRVAMVCQPDWKKDADFTRFGRPRLAFLVAAGNMDSMVNHYTVAKRRRSADAYSPGGKMGLRPDRATIVYANCIRRIYGDIPIIIGGVEASLRRFSHYDYWDDKVRPPILQDSGADLLSYGMGELSMVEIARLLDRGVPVGKITSLSGTCAMVDDLSRVKDYVLLPSHEEAAGDKKAYAQAFAVQYGEQDPIRGKRLVQPVGSRYLVQNPPSRPLTREELDAVYALPYARTYHPDYEKQGGIPAIDEVKFSISSARGCFGACNFCALTFHQGRIVQSRSPDSIVAEAERLTHEPDFKGYIHDLSAPTVNFRQPACVKQLEHGACAHRQCLTPKPCPNLKADHSELVGLLRRLRGVPGVKKVFLRSGLRFDYLMLDRDETFFREMVRHHISGQLKVAPEHVAANALRFMGKPECGVYREFVKRYEQLNRQEKADQYLVPYFMSSHPGCTLKDAVELAEYLRDIHHQPEQVQDFYPTPGTLSTAMYYTGRHPLTGEKVYVPRTPEEKAMQRALMQYAAPRNHALVRKALRMAGREDLIGTGGKCLVPAEAGKPAQGAQQPARMSLQGSKLPAGGMRPLRGGRERIAPKGKPKKKK